MGDHQLRHHSIDDSAFLTHNVFTLLMTSDVFFSEKKNSIDDERVVHQKNTLLMMSDF